VHDSQEGESKVGDELPPLFFLLLGDLQSIKKELAQALHEEGEKTYRITHPSSK
jgi:hypothetical protein